MASRVLAPAPAPSFRRPAADRLPSRPRPPDLPLKQAMVLAHIPPQGIAEVELERALGLGPNEAAAVSRAMLRRRLIRRQPMGGREARFRLVLAARGVWARQWLEHLPRALPPGVFEAAPAATATALASEPAVELIPAIRQRWWPRRASRLAGSAPEARVAGDSEVGAVSRYERGLILVAMGTAAFLAAAIVGAISQNERTTLILLGVGAVVAFAFLVAALAQLYHRRPREEPPTAPLGGQSVALAKPALANVPARPGAERLATLAGRWHHRAMGRSLSGLFSFPNPVNEVAARWVAGGAAAIGLLALAAHLPWLCAVLAYGFLARVATGPTLSPMGQLATRLLAPRTAPAKLVAGPPKRFAQAMGAVLTVTATVVYFAFGLTTVTYALLGALVVAATLESVFAICLGCQIFGLLMRRGLIPEEVCEACADLSSPAAQARREAQREGAGT